MRRSGRLAPGVRRSTRSPPRAGRQPRSSCATESTVTELVVHVPDPDDAPPVWAETVERDDDDPLAVSMVITVLRDCEIRAVQMVLAHPRVRATGAVQVIIQGDARFPTQAGADGRLGRPLRLRLGVQLRVNGALTERSQPDEQVRIRVVVVTPARRDEVTYDLPDTGSTA